MANRELDLAMDAAWPAAVTEPFGEWLLRYTSGVTRRANSALTLGESSDVDASIAAAEDFYSRHGAPATFMVTEASTARSTIDALISRGYEATADTWMLETTPAEIRAAGPDDSRWQVAVSSTPSDSWFETYWSVDPTRGGLASDATVLREVLLGAPGTVFVELADGERSAAVGQVVVGDRWACAQCLATAPWARRLGAGSQVMRQLAVEAANAGATGFFAAVMANNEASLNLCEALSLRRSHRYSYYVRP